MRGIPCASPPVKNKDSSAILRLMITPRQIVVRVALVCVLALPAAANAADKPRDYSAVPMPFVNNLQQRASREAFIAAAFSPFRQFDKNGDGLVPAELEQSEVIERAQQRASNLSALYAFATDASKRPRSNVPMLTHQARDCRQVRVR